MRLLKTVFVTLFFIAAITFAIKNQESVSLQYYFINEVWTMPIFLLVFISILVGVLVAGFGGVFSGFKLKQEIKRQQKTILELEDELNSLRNLPIMESKQSYE
ncbi:MAG: LapA family protein [Thermodesulfobacteriota bacterium]